MTEATTRTYDDHPESDVATVLQVPLLWPVPGRPPARSESGRHRAATPRPGHPVTVTPGRSPDTPGHPMLLAFGVGVASASIVLVVFGLTLLALARWMP